MGNTSHLKKTPVLPGEKNTAATAKNGSGTKSTTIPATSVAVMKQYLSPSTPGACTPLPAHHARAQGSNVTLALGSCCLLTTEPSACCHLPLLPRMTLALHHAKSGTWTGSCCLLR